MYSTNHEPSMRERMFRSRTEVAVGAGLSAILLVAVGVNMMDSSADSVVATTASFGEIAKMKDTCKHPRPHVSCSATASLSNGQGLLVFEAQSGAQDIDTFQSSDFGFAGVHCHVKCNGYDETRRLTEADYSKLEYLHFNAEDSLAPTFDYGVLTDEACCTGYCRSYTPDCTTEYVEQECCHKPKPAPKPHPEKPVHDHDHDHDHLGGGGGGGGGCDDDDDDSCAEDCATELDSCQDTCDSTCDDSTCAAECDASCNDDSTDCEAECDFGCGYGSSSFAAGTPTPLTPSPSPSPTTPSPTTTPTSPTPSPTTPSPTTTPTISPTYYIAPLNFDIYTLTTTGGGGNHYQYTALYDSQYALRPSAAAGYNVRLSWEDANGDFRGFKVRNDMGLSFPTGYMGTNAHPPILDGFGTFKLGVALDRGGEGSLGGAFLPPVPVEDTICQQDFATIGRNDQFPNDPVLCTEGAGAFQIYGQGIGPLLVNDFVYIWDMCSWGLRGGRTYSVWFSPYFQDGSYARCPFKCDTSANSYQFTLNDGMDGAGGSDTDFCFGIDPDFPARIATCTNVVDNTVDGDWGMGWTLASVDMDDGQWAVPECCSYIGVGTTYQTVPTAICDTQSCDDNEMGLSECVVPVGQM